MSPDQSAQVGCLHGGESCSWHGGWQALEDGIVRDTLASPRPSRAHTGSLPRVLSTDADATAREADDNQSCPDDIPAPPSGARNLLEGVPSHSGTPPCAGIWKPATRKTRVALSIQGLKAGFKPCPQRQHTYTHSHTHTHTHTNAHTHTYTTHNLKILHTYTLTHTYSQTHTYIYSHNHTIDTFTITHCTHSHTHNFALMNSHLAHTHNKKYINKYTRTHTRIH